MSESSIERMKRKLPTEVFDTSETSNLYGLLKSFSNQIDNFETQLTNLKNEIQISTSSGTYLEDYAKIFNLQRKSGETDDELRNRILAYWVGFSGGGIKENIKSTAAIFSGVDEADITITEMFDLKFKVELTMLSGSLKEDLVNLVWDTKAAGVYPFFTFTLLDEAANNNIVVSDSIEVTSESVTKYFRTEYGVVSDTILEDVNNYYMRIGDNTIGNSLVA